jgi:hypothetical protein
MNKLKAVTVSWEGGDYTGPTEPNESGILVPHGRGKWVSSDGMVVRTGNFTKGKLNGEGESINTQTKDKYIGEFKDNIRHGLGYLFFAGFVPSPLKTISLCFLFCFFLFFVGSSSFHSIHINQNENFLDFFPIIFIVFIVTLFCVQQ